MEDFQLDPELELATQGFSRRDYAVLADELFRQATLLLRGKPITPNPRLAPKIQAALQYLDGIAAEATPLPGGRK